MSIRENLSTWSWRRVAAAVALCVGPHSTAASQGAALLDVATVAMHARRTLVENSAAAMSARQPGVLFTINDSGNDALLFAIDTTGADRGAWRVAGSTNVDWESAAIGPCGTPGDAARPRGGVPSCVYIGDTGDNDERRPARTIYRVDEPHALKPGKTGTVHAEALTYVYADRPHDVEAMYVAPNGDIFLVTKRVAAGAGRRRRPALVFRLTPDGWGKNARSVAELVDSLPIVPGSAPLRLITDASLAPDARHLAVRTYTQVFVFATDSLTGRVNHGVPPSVCDLVPLGEPQGEGITWADRRGRFAFTSEGATAALHLADCPPPRI